MIPITRPITRFPWYGADLPLSSAYPWKVYVRLLRVPNATGTGFSTNNATAAPQSYSIIRAGDLVELVAKDIPSGGFLVDNGEPPMNRFEPKSFSFSFPANSTALTLTSDSVCLTSAATLSGGITAGIGTIVYRVDNVAYNSLSEVNTEIASRTETDLATNGIELQIQLIRASTSNEVTATLTVTY